jgi:hypothetical protein
MRTHVVISFSRKSPRICYVRSECCVTSMCIPSLRASSCAADHPISIRQHTSAYVSICQHTSAYVSIRVYHPCALRHALRIIDFVHLHDCAWEVLFLLLPLPEKKKTGIEFPLCILRVLLVTSPLDAYFC